MYEQPSPSSRRESGTAITLADVVESIGDHWFRYLLLGVAAIATVNIVAVARQPDEPLYHAEALVVATTLEIRVDSLPRTASAIFNGGSVARIAAEASGTDVDPDDLIPHIVKVQPVENTTVVEVDALHPDPNLAALYANVAGQALVDEMNRIGPGLGTFELGFEATAPREPEEESIIPYVVFSPVAALFLVVGTAIMVTFVQQQKRRLFGTPEPTPRPSGTSSPIWSMPSRGADEPIEPAVSAPGPERSTFPEDGHQEDSHAVHELQTDHIDQPARPGMEISIEELSEFHWHETDGEREFAPEPEPFVKPLERLKRPAPIHPFSAMESQAQELIDLVNGIGPVYGGRLAVLGITKLHQLASANPKWIASAVEVPEEMVIDWIRQAVGFTGSQRQNDG